MKIYLAIPYTWNNEKSFQVANKVTAKLMLAGHVVFSPISHNHIVADHLPNETRYDLDWWMNQDLAFVDWADEVYCVCIGEFGSELICHSKGVQMEIAHAQKQGKKITIIDYYD